MRTCAHPAVTSTQLGPTVTLSLGNLSSSESWMAVSCVPYMSLARLSIDTRFL